MIQHSLQAGMTSSDTLKFVELIYLKPACFRALVFCWHLHFSDGIYMILMTKSVVEYRKLSQTKVSPLLKMCLKRTDGELFARKTVQVIE